MPRKKSEVPVAVIVDKVGEFAWIDKNELHVDERYQRNASQARVNKLAASWSWVACGAISVALREDAKWWVIDGQHRVLAAKLLSGISQMPCLVFEVESIQEEATGFINANKNRRPMTATELHNASVEAGDHISMVINELVINAGRHISGAGGAGNVKSIACVGAMRSDIADNEQLFRKIWPVITEVCTEARITQGIVHAFYHLEKMAIGQSLTEKHWRDRLRAIGVTKIQSEITAAVAFYGRGNKAVYATGLLKAINRNAKKRFESRIAPDIKMAE